MTDYTPTTEEMLDGYVTMRGREIPGDRVLAFIRGSGLRITQAGRQSVMGMKVWHDEAQRFERTGRLDQGPCWCPECIEAELAAARQEGADQ